MKRVIVVYESVFGNTERLAHIIAEGIKETNEIECVVRKLGEVHPNELAEYDALVFGCPNHNQEPARNLLKFLERVAIVDLTGKYVAAFDTYTGGNKGVAVSKLERFLTEKIPNIKLLVHGLSAQVAGRRGPLVEMEIERARTFGKKIAQAIKK